MKRPMAYRVDENGQMTIKPVTVIEFVNDDAFKFQLSGIGWFQQRSYGSFPIGILADTTRFVNHPFKIFDSESDAWQHELERLQKEKSELHSEVHRIISKIDLAARNLAQASQNETKPPE
jgi:hypothetical protein